MFGDVGRVMSVSQEIRGSMAYKPLAIEEEEIRPVHPIVIVPGLCSSALKVSAGYHKWLDQRIWLSVKRMGRERLRLFSNTEKHKCKFFDPNAPLVTSGFVHIREGSVLSRNWPKYYFKFNTERKLLQWFAEEYTVVVVNANAPSNSVPDIMLTTTTAHGVFEFTKKTQISIVNRSPTWANFGFSVQLSNGHPSRKVYLCESSEESTLDRYKQFVILMNHLFPESNIFGKKKKKVRTGSEEKKKQKPSTNLWLDHLNLMEDGISDPPGIRVRPIDGLRGIDYLETSPLIKDASYVFGPVIDHLTMLGYTEKMLKAMPYDWRIPPFHLQQRDSYFTRLQHTIEELVGTTGKPVILLAHSMGNKVAHYFLNFIQYSHPDPTQWLFRHIHMLFALGAPWLGATKSLRGLAVGDKMGLDAFIQLHDAIKMSRRMGSAPWLFPREAALHFRDSSVTSFGMLKTEEGVLIPLSIEEMLKEAGAEKVLDIYEKCFLSDPLFHHNKDLDAPPIPWILCVYGVNVDTEISFVATRKPQMGSKLSLDKSATHESLLTKDGIIYECCNTVQPLLEAEGAESVRRSGDGTVPYASLRYPSVWKKDGYPVEFVELEGAQHRDILCDPGFLQILEDCATGRRTYSKNDDRNPLSQTM